MKKTFLHPPYGYKIEEEKKEFRATRYRTFFFLSAGILFMFVARTLLSVHFPVPRMNDLFTAFTLAGSFIVLLAGFVQIKTSDWIIAMGAGLLVGVTMYYATLFTPYDLFGVVRGHLTQAWARGLSVFIAMLAGLAIMRQGGAGAGQPGPGKPSENIHEYCHWAGRGCATGNFERLCFAVHPGSTGHLAKPVGCPVRRSPAGARRGSGIPVCLFRSDVDVAAAFHAAVGGLAGGDAGTVRPQFHAL